MSGAEEIDDPVELDRIRAAVATIMHPLRLRLVSGLAMESSLGVEELARRLGVSVRTARRHIDLLVEEELVAVEREESRRGVVKRYFATRGPLRIDPGRLGASRVPVHLARRT